MLDANKYTALDHLKRKIKTLQVNATAIPQFTTPITQSGINT